MDHCQTSNITGNYYAAFTPNFKLKPLNGWYDTEDQYHAMIICVCRPQSGNKYIEGFTFQKGMLVSGPLGIFILYTEILHSL